MPYAQMDDPQSLNLYAYVRNNPLSKADADGHCPWCLAAAGGAILTDEAPLALTGPVGWTIIGVTAVGVVGVAIYQHMQNDAPAPAPTPAATPAPAATHNDVPAPADTGNPHAPGDVPNDQVVVRGGTNPPPSSGTWSGAQGATIGEAGKGVPNGQVQPSTGGQIRAAGGEVRPAPEPPYPGAPVNGQHVSVTGGQSAFGPPVTNPAPKPDRVVTRPQN